MIEYIKRIIELKQRSSNNYIKSLLHDFVGDQHVVSLWAQIEEAEHKIVQLWNQKCQAEDIINSKMVLPNGTVNRPYNYSFDLDSLPFSQFYDYHVEIEQEVGLYFLKAENKIIGTPLVDGNHELHLHFSLKAENGDIKPYQKVLGIMCNPDPRSLWRNIPTPSDIEYYSPDEESNTFLYKKDKQLLIASKRGRSHAHDGKPRDDSFDYYLDKDWAVIAVADGAGSSAYSRKGAKIACEYIKDFFINISDSELSDLDDAVEALLKEESEHTQKQLSHLFIKHLSKAAFNARTAIKEESDKIGVDIKEFATTLLFVLFKKFDDKYVVASFWVGDGCIGIYSQERNEVSILGVPDSGEFAGQTRFLTMNDIFNNSSYVSRIRFCIVENFTALVLMTDGITDPKFSTDANLNRADKWKEFWDDLNGVNEDKCKIPFEDGDENDCIDALMRWLDFWNQGNHDDRTIAILYNKNG